MHAEERPSRVRGLRGSRKTFAFLLNFFFFLVSVYVARLQGAESASQAEAIIAAWTNRISLVVLPFENKTGDSNLNHWSCAAYMLSDELGHVRSVRLLSDEAVSYGLWQIKNKRGGHIEAAQARKLGESIEARRVLWGEFDRQGNQWSVTARLLNVASGSVSPVIRATSADWFAVRDQLLRAILEDFQITLNAREQTNMFTRGTTSAVALESLVKAGSLYYQLAGYDKVESMARQALEADPKYEGAKVVLASALGSQGKFEEAFATIRRVLDSEPKNSQARMVLGVLYMLQEKLPQAEDELRAVLRQDPDHSDACERLGEIYHAQDWTTRAVIYFQKARDINSFQVSARAHLGALYAIQGKRELALAELREAERLSAPDAGLGNAEQIFCLAYVSLNDIPHALQHYDKYLPLARQLAIRPELIKDFEERYLKLKSTMTPQPLTAISPQSFSEESLLQLVRQKLTADEFRYITNPIASTPEMRQWARQLTQGATNHFQKAKMLFDALMLHLDPVPGSTRTAVEVYRDWNKPGIAFHCQEYARLFVALGRAVGLDTFYTYVEKDFNTNIVHHACAAVRVEDKFLLVDPTYTWFGVPHRSFEIKNDLEALVGWLSQVRDLRLRRLGAKLLPDSFQANVDLFLGLANENRWDEARVLLKKVVMMNPDHWLTRYAQARLMDRDNRLDEAIDLLQKSLKENPIMPGPHLFLADVLREQKKWREARDELRAALCCKISEEEADYARRGIALINEKIGSD